MSFFDSNNSKPREINFQESYAELHDDDDEFNNETFGGDISTIGRDFNFGEVAQQPQLQQAQKISYAAAASTPAASQNMDFSVKPLDSLWGTNTLSAAPQSQQQHHQQQQPEKKKILSLEELEASINSIPTSGNNSNQHMFPHQGFPTGAAQFPPGMPPPPGFVGSPMNYMPAGVPLPPHHHMGYPVAGPPPHMQMNYMPGPPPHMGAGHLPPQFAQLPVMQVGGGPLPMPSLPQQPQGVPPLNTDSKTNEESKQQQPQQPPALPQHQHQPIPEKIASMSNKESNNLEKSPLTPEEEAKLAIKSKKLERMSKYHNIMTPKDKDFVTRCQISQIVTDDPYNEDFYYQIFKVIRSHHPAASLQNDDGSLNYIAQYYLEHSGHKLGGKFQRVDVALQRMQHQVSRAVSVARDRPKNSQYTKEGSLGKISIASGKTPKRQLEIMKKEIESNANTDVKGISNDLKLSDENNGGSSITKLRKTDSLLGLENAYLEVLKLEACEKNHEPIDPTNLWNSLNIDNQGKIEENLFVSYLNFDKGIKLFARILRYLTNDQKLKLIENFIKKISLLKVIKQSSYDYYYSGTLTKEQTSKIDKKCEFFTSMVLKFIISYISNDLKFNDIVKLIIAIINYNSLTYILPNKIGLTLITVLISKIELIKQDINIMSSDLIIWTNVYDKLFNTLINNLITVFPKDLYVDDKVSFTSLEEHKLFDDSYIWHFLASLALAGKLQHQRIIVDEIREKVFECVEFAKKLNSDDKLKFEAQTKLNHLNLFLNVMGLNANENGDITELK